MDMLTLAMAKAYTDSKQLASAETTLSKIFEAEEEGFGLDAVDLSLVPSGAKCIVEFEEKTYERVVSYEYGDAFIGNLGLDGGEDTGEPFIIYFQDGMTIVLYQSGHSGTIRVYVDSETIHPIDPKFIPALDSITLNSPGGKRFTLMVDDSGTITATEA